MSTWPSKAAVSGAMPMAVMTTSQSRSKSLPDTGSGPGPTRRVRRSGGHLRADAVRHAAPVRAEHLLGGRLEHEGHTFLLGIVSLHVVGGHLGTCASVDHRDLAGTEAPCGARGVHGHVAAADDDDTAAAQVDIVAELHRAQEAGPAEDPIELLAGRPRPVESGVPVATSTAS